MAVLHRFYCKLIVLLSCEFQQGCYKIILTISANIFIVSPIFSPNLRTFCIKENSEDPDQIPHYAVSDLGLHCLHISHKKDVILIIIYWFNKLPVA